MKAIARLLAVPLLIALAGCTQWQAPRALPPPEDGPVSVPSARVTPRTTGMTVVLRNLQITPDSVIGWEQAVDPSGLLRGPARRVAVHRDEVLVFEPVVRESRATAAGIIVGVVVVALGVYGLYMVTHCC